MLFISECLLFYLIGGVAFIGAIHCLQVLRRVIVLLVEFCNQIHYFLMLPIIVSDGEL